MKAGKQKESSRRPSDLLLVNFRADILCEVIMLLLCLLDVFREQKGLFFFPLVTVPSGILS